MDSVVSDTDLIERILLDFAAVCSGGNGVRCEPIFDKERGRFLLMNEGWHNQRRVHGVQIHVELVNGEFWIHADWTEEGVTRELMKAGVSKSRIVPAWRRPDIRNHPEFRSAWCESA